MFPSIFNSRWKAREIPSCFHSAGSRKVVVTLASALLTVAVTYACIFHCRHLQMHWCMEGTRPWGHSDTSLVPLASPHWSWAAEACPVCGAESPSSRGPGRDPQLSPLASLLQLAAVWRKSFQSCFSQHETFLPLQFYFFCVMFPECVQSRPVL